MESEKRVRGDKTLITIKIVACVIIKTNSEPPSPNVPQSMHINIPMIMRSTKPFSNEIAKVSSDPSAAPSPRRLFMLNRFIKSKI